MCPRGSAQLTAPQHEAFLADDPWETRTHGWLLVCRGAAERRSAACGLAGSARPATRHDHEIQVNEARDAHEPRQHPEAGAIERPG